MTQVVNSMINNMRRRVPHSICLTPVLVLAFMSMIGNANASLPSFLNPAKGETPAEEMLCYGIPFGGIGFASHILTYYTLACLWNGRRPLMPWKKLEYGRFNFLLGIFTLVGTVGF